MACSGRLQRGGEPAALTTPDTKQDEFAHWWPEVLPGGHAVLFTVVKGVGIQNMEIAVLDLRTGERRTLLPGGSVRRGGQSRRGAESGVGGPRRPGGGARHASTRLHLSPRISPDGTRLALNLRDEENDIWLWDFAREMLTRLTFDPGQDRFPLWSPDGRRIAFSSQRDKSRGNPFWQAADGTGTVERLAEMSGRQVFPTSFSPDGTQLLVYGDAAGNPDDDDVSVVQTQGEPRATPLLHTMFREHMAELSPDGRWLAYISNESGRDEVYVRPFPDVDKGRWQVSTGGGDQPTWSRNGRELFFRNGAALMAVPVQTDRGFAAGNAKVVLKGAYATPLGGRSYDVSPDGRRFLMIKEGAATGDDAPLAQIILVQNWTEELKRVVPTR